MNILAHCYLSQGDPDILLGNFIADGLSRKKWEKLAKKVVTGIQLHHFIDGFTDTHKEVHALVDLLRPEQGKYAPVVSDILFDHLLALHWNEYHHQDLAEYVSWVYEQLELNLQLMTPSRKRAFTHMKNYNWLLGYASEEGVRQTLNGMGRRSRFPSKMAEGFDHYLQNKEAWKKGFERFFPTLVDASKQELIRLKSVEDQD